MINDVLGSLPLITKAYNPVISIGAQIGEDSASIVANIVTSICFILGIIGYQWSFGTLSISISGFLTKWMIDQIKPPQIATMAKTITANADELIQHLLIYLCLFYVHDEMHDLLQE